MQVSNRIRRHYTPLNLSYNIVCTTPGSPVVQTLDGTGYNPDRSVVYTALLPYITGKTADGSWNNSRSNMSLVTGSIKWMVLKNSAWINIKDDASWNGKYDIVLDDTTDKGTIRIKRNVEANDKQQLYFEADLLDYRNKNLVHIKTDPVTLYTVKKGDDTYGIGLGCESNISYNPVLDALSLYEYKVANGIMEASDSERAKCLDGNEYVKVIPIDVYLSKDRVTEGYSLQVFRVDTTGKAVQIAVSTADAPNELMALTLTAMTLDLRLVEKNDYIIKVIVNGKVMAQTQFNVTRAIPAISFGFRNRASISYSQQMRSNEVFAKAQNRTIEYPQRVATIQWMTVAHNDDMTDHVNYWQEGERCEYRIQDTGLGNTEQCELEECIEYEPKPALAYSVDAQGNVYVGDNGEPFLIG